LNKSSCNSLPTGTHAPKHPIKALYEDDHYIVFDKPAGLLVIPTAKNENRTLVNIVNQQYAADEKSWKLHPCHRIDEDTSGVIIFAKGKHAQQLMMDLFKRRSITKKYIAFIHGRLPSEKGEFRNPVYKQFGRKRVFSSAITRYKVLNVKKNFSVVEVQPITGRTNQIRIHFSQAGHPLLGERKFAFARDYALKFRRTALHAASIAWMHPVYHRSICVQSEVPKDMAEFITGK
jgi:23S rRNA pseudouridine1911/1915/1917 synthase